MNDEELAARYRAGESLAKVGAAAGVSAVTVWQRLRRAGEPTRPKRTAFPRERVEPLVARGLIKGQIAAELGCSAGLVTRLLAMYGLTAADGRSKPAPRSHQDRTRLSGYWMIYRPDHPRADARGRVMEHRLVVEAQIGRYLEPREIVHHMNHVRDDNRPENLMLLPDQAAHGRVHYPKGKAVADGNVVRWRKS